MSDDRPQTHDCLDAETLAAFIDGRLEPREREAVEAHLATCEDCYEVWMEGMATVTESIGVDSSTPPARTLRLDGWYWAAAVAAVLTLATVLILPRGSQHERSMENLVEAVGHDRFTEARLSDSFSWGPRPNVIRGDSDTSSSISSGILSAAAALESGLEHDSSGPALRARGIAAVATRDLDRSVDLLERALEADSANVAVRIDLTAVLLERYRHRGNSVDALRAEATIAPVVVHDQAPPAALFNHALAVEASRGREEAVAAWQRYLAVDSTSNWAQEARGRIERENK